MILETVESQSECLLYLLVAPQDVSKWHSKVQTSVPSIAVGWLSEPQNVSD